MCGIWRHRPSLYVAGVALTYSTQLTRTLSYAQLAHTQPSHKQLSHTQLSHTHLFPTICRPPSPKKELTHTFSNTFRRHLQSHTGVHENIYFAVWIVVFLTFDSVVFFGPVICPCHLSLSFVPVICLSFFVFLSFFIDVLHVLMILLCLCHFSMVFFDFLHFLICFL